MEYTAAIPINILTKGQLTINATAVVYTEAFVLTRHRCFSLEVLFSSDTDVAVKIELEQGNVRPSVQGSYSSNFIVATPVVGTVTDENVHIYPLSPVVSVYARLKLTGLSDNSVTTKVTRANLVEVES